MLEILKPNKCLLSEKWQARESQWHAAPMEGIISVELSPEQKALAFYGSGRLRQKKRERVSSGKLLSQGGEKCPNTGLHEEASRWWHLCLSPWLQLPPENYSSGCGKGSFFLQDACQAKPWNCQWLDLKDHTVDSGLELSCLSENFRLALRSHFKL